MGQTVLIEGFQLPNEEISASTFMIRVDAPDPAPASPELLEFRGRVTVAPTPTERVTWISEAIVEAMAQDVVVVAAAGNDNSSEPRYPAAQSGVGITSTIVGPQGSGYATWSGTSMATPFVSGASALMRQRNPDLSAVQIASKVMRYSSELSQMEPVHTHPLGGLLDLDAALALAELDRTLYMPVVRRE